MRKILFLIFCLILLSLFVVLKNNSKPVVLAQTGTYDLPAERSIDWNPGIPGGIPTYPATRNAVTDDGAVGDGITDDTAAIQSCINNLTANQACYLPPGTYRVSSQLNMLASNTVLRGAGANSKIIRYGTNAGDIISLGAGNEGSFINISSGYTKGSTSLIFPDALAISSILVGDYIVVVQSNDSSVDSANCGYCGINNDETKAMNQIVRVTNKVDNALTINRPLYYTFQASLAPQIIRFSLMETNVGVENLYVENDSSTSDLVRANVNIYKCAYCWVKGIESYNANRSHIRLTEAYGAEIRDNKFSYGHSYGGDHAYGVFIFVTNSDHLIENNIFYHLRHSMVLEGGGSGNVFGYNYSEFMWDANWPDTDWLMGDLITHGAHPYMNLFEGNIVNHISADYVHGSASHNTYLRNYSDTQSEGAIYALRSVEAMKANTSLNFIGNILGYIGSYTAYENGLGSGINSRTGANDFIYTFGYSSDGDTTSDDQNPYNTVLRHGNYDYFNNSAIWNGSDDQDLPNSLYLASKPSWWDTQSESGKCRPWPSIGPDVSEYVIDIPAKDRYEGQAYNSLSCIITPPPSLKGDFNSDSKVNDLDFTVFKNAFKSIFNSLFDLNSDNAIDVKDLGVLMSGWRP